MTTSGQQRQVVWTRLSSNGQGPDRRGHRRLVMAVAVVVLLIAAIALANRGWSSQSATAADPLAPEIPRSREGAQTAAARMAGLLGSERMFSEQYRHALLQVIAEPEKRSKTIQDYDAQYTALTKRIGLDSEGSPPAGTTFVSRTSPVGTTVQTYSGTQADVDVWCSTLFGLTGAAAGDKAIPLKTAWVTMTLNLSWTEDGWKLVGFDQKTGPTPKDADPDFGEAPLYP
ncbi:hypothetical protein [Streptomyces sp. NPDC006335]|uniref:hypothetical protein n=1 Tax=Streptomyces sp. NPDC006335 TaxID=3156895 RepID=UPI0033B60A17